MFKKLKNYLKIGAIIALSLNSSLLRAQASKSPIRNLVIGTYTKSGISKGIYVYSFNTLTGKFNQKNMAEGVENPSYLAISHNHQFVYAVNENHPGTVTSFGFNSKSGELTKLNQVPTGGDDPCYISVDKRNKFVFIANYSGGSLSAIPIRKDGSLSDTIQIIQHHGKGPDTLRQEKAHVHMAYLNPLETKILTSDLGTDSINFYSIRFENKSNPLMGLSKQGFMVEPGAGPRHMIFHPNGKILYLLQEMKARIDVYVYNPEKLIKIQSIDMEPSSFSGKLGAADIHISQDGKFLYATDRGDANDILIFKIGTNMKLTRIGKESVLGKTPRNFTLDPSGNFLLVANQNSDEIVIFKRNKITGKLKPLNERIHIGSPVCLKFE